MVQFYRDMWKRRSYVPTLPIDLLGKGNQKIEWIDIYQKAFGDIKRIMNKKINLNYLEFAAVKILDLATSCFKKLEIKDKNSARNR